MTDKTPGSSDPQVHAAMKACITSARHLVESAKAVLAAGKPNIAYHLAAAALEEIGKREIYAVQDLSSKEPVPPSWPQKHALDHVQKLFWCFFGPSFYETLTKDSLLDMQSLARRVHEKRMAGLYVDANEQGLSEPHTAITEGESENLIGLAEARVEIASAQVPRTPAPEETVQQDWLLRTATDPRTRNLIMSSGSMAKLAELKDVKEWVSWLQKQFADAESAGHEAMKAELERSKSLPGKRTKDKWKVRVRFMSDSHSVRGSVFKTWNDKSDWIKLTAVSGKKKQLDLDIILGDNVPVEALWFYAWGIARHFATALNIGSMGFWWWKLPTDISRYYTSIEDLESKSEVGLERRPSLKVDWGENRVLSDEDMARTAMAFAALPGPNNRELHGAYNHYIGGITFLSLNDVHWQCELQAIHQFLMSLKGMMQGAGDWDGTGPIEEPMRQFLTEMFPSFEEVDDYLKLAREVDARTARPESITLKEASFMKLFCDAYFLRRVQPEMLRKVDEMRKAQGGEAERSKEGGPGTDSAT